MIPRALYIHMPWCIQKCPYCDFNSHNSPKSLPEDQYIDALISDLKSDLARFPHNIISSIFIGGGTPSLFSAKSYEKLFTALQDLTSWEKNIEITMEANPGTVEQQRFKAYHTLGINRLSLGIQSFNAEHLKSLGRIHDERQAKQAIVVARQAGFDNINLDIMHGLPGQTIAQGINDLQTALDYEPEHLSWYQLTIEPNTVFYKNRPTLPNEDTADAIEEQGLALLSDKFYNRYEISAFSKPGKASKHNLNYWQFGDYFGIGAGAHGKLTSANYEIIRTRKARQPEAFLATNKPFLSEAKSIAILDVIFEFMLNTTRLEQAIPLSLFPERTGLKMQQLHPFLEKARAKGFITLSDTHWQVTELGRRYTNDLQALFLPEE